MVLGYIFLWAASVQKITKYTNLLKTDNNYCIIVGKVFDYQKDLRSGADHEFHIIFQKVKVNYNLLIQTYLVTNYKWQNH